MDRFPALGEAAAVVSAPVSQAAVATTVPESKEEHAESTDLDHQLKELDVEESDSSDEEDNEPLTAIKAKLDTGEKTLNGKAEPSSAQAVSAPVDPFAASQSLSAVQSVPSTPAAGQSSTIPDISATVAPKEPVPVSAVSATPAADTSPKVNGTVSSAQASVPVSAPATVNDFDEAMGNLSASSGAPSQLSQFTFDSAFDDNFDFAAATAATHPQPTQPTTNEVFGSALPAPPAAAPNGFDNVFMTQPTSSTAVPAPVAPAVPVFPAPPPASETKPFSFDDAFGSGAGSAPPAGQPSSSSDTFGAPGHQPPPGSPPAKVTAAPFPTTTSTPSSPHGRNSPQSFRRSISPPHRHASPPPRHSSPKPRPSTSSSDKEKPPTRHSKLSIRLPQQLVEEPTPAVEDDVESVKTLCGMGFSRTQAVAALEEHGYDVQRALNSLLGAH
ncbi:hypothetical protein A0H81_04597 [Grifola frondosa]|uniref:UBA domain-containing protein n=1 Tax=Grifola frondosa TaxID=5627 RepID=A0A1C7MFL3_GRIFR|nr:hypothetical protein A0H81_04597 [Grifola frondosa]